MAQRRPNKGRPARTSESIIIDRLVIKTGVFAGLYVAAFKAARRGGRAA